MKYIFLLVGVLFCFLLGYLIEPSLRGSLTYAGQATEVEALATESGSENESDSAPEDDVEEEAFDPFGL